MRIGAPSLVLLAALAWVAGCKRAPSAPPEKRDAGTFDHPPDRLGANELVPKQETMLGFDLPRGFEVVDAAPEEATAQGSATLEEIRRHVAEHSLNGVLRERDGALEWWGAEIPGLGSKRFHLRAARDVHGDVTLTVRAEVPRPVVDGGAKEILRALGFDESGQHHVEGDDR
jgi:hypothetical protein